MDDVLAGVVIHSLDEVSFDESWRMECCLKKEDQPTLTSSLCFFFPLASFSPPFWVAIPPLFFLPEYSSTAEPLAAFIALYSLLLYLIISEVTN